MTVSALVWAMDQSHGSPLGKLALIAISDWADERGEWTVCLSKLAHFCGVDEGCADDALTGLYAARLISTAPGVVRLPFYRNEPARPTGDPQWRIGHKRRSEIYARDNYRCVYCGETGALSLDHIVPQIKGGGHEDENLATACRRCNSSKRDRDLADWLASK